MPSPGRFRMAYDEPYDEDEYEEDESEHDEDDDGEEDEEDESETWQVGRSQPQIVLHRSRARRLTFPR